MSELSADDLKTKGNKAFSEQNYDEAVSFFTQAISIEPNNAVLYSNRSGAYASQKNFQKALEDAKRCVELKPSWSKSYSRQALAEFSLGLHSNAIKSYEKALELDPSNQVVQTALENVKAAAQPNPPLNFELDMLIEKKLLTSPKFKAYADEDPNYVNRVKSFLMKIAENPMNLNLIMAMEPDTRIQEAIEILLHISPHSEKAKKAEEDKKREKENALKKEKEKKESSELLLNRSSNEAEADSWKEKGNQLYSQRNFDEALTAYDKAVELFPSNITYYTNKAAVYLEMKNYEECLAECQKALDMRYEVKADYDKVAKVYSRMAMCYRRQQNYDKAIEMYEKCLTEDNKRQYRSELSETKRLKEKKLQEDYIKPELAEEHRLKGNEYFKEKQFPEAKIEYDEAIKRNPKDARLYANRSATLMKLLELPMALADADKALELDPSTVKIWARKGTIHAMMKEYNKATAAFQEGLKLDNQNWECHKGLNDVVQKIQESATSETVDEEQVRHAMADPEIQALLADPQFALVLRSISENPSKLETALKDPRIASGIQRLMAAGILKLGR